MTEAIIVAEYESPAGGLLLGSYGDRLCMCDWLESRRHESNKAAICRRLSTVMKPGSTEAILRAADELDRYFAGELREFSTPLLILGTDFQCRVRKEMLAIPFGCTITYADLSRRVENEKAVRAVAGAVASNPLSLFVPCHRVVGSRGGSLTGYAGGLEAKRFLLNLEERLPL